MMDFKRKIEEGISAEKASVKRRAEINQILDNLNTELIEATDHKVECFLGFTFLNTFEAAIKSLNILEPMPGRKTALMVRAKGSEVSNGELICLFEKSDSGYPVIITQDKYNYHCNNKSELEMRLGQVMASPTTGAAILKIINRVNQ